MTSRSRVARRNRRPWPVCRVHWAHDGDAALAGLQAGRILLLATETRLNRDKLFTIFRGWWFMRRDGTAPAHHTNPLNQPDTWRFARCLASLPLTSTRSSGLLFLLHLVAAPSGPLAYPRNKLMVLSCVTQGVPLLRIGTRVVGG
jgi:hypothetical protein